jgi:hypothetical protein
MFAFMRPTRDECWQVLQVLQGLQHEHTSSHVQQRFGVVYPEHCYGYAAERCVYLLACMRMGVVMG